MEVFACAEKSSRKKEIFGSRNENYEPNDSIQILQVGRIRHRNPNSENESLPRDCVWCFFFPLNQIMQLTARTLGGYREKSLFTRCRDFIFRLSI